MRRRYRQDPETGELYEIPVDAPSVAPKAHIVIPDIPDYTSPIDGRLISGRKQRREDLARNGCRPYEGFEAEKKEADRHRQAEDRAQERRMGEYVEQTYYQLRDGMTPRSSNG